MPSITQNVKRNAFAFQKPLGDTVLQARGQAELTQNQVASMIGKDSRTILNIENYAGNPKLEVLYPLVRTLHIDPRAIFYPETTLASPNLRRLRVLVDSCSESDAQELIPVIESMLKVLHKHSNEKIE